MIRKGSLPKLFKAASEAAQSQHATIVRHLDTLATAEDPSQGSGTGGVLKRQDHLLLLATNESYQQDQLARMSWMTQQEREQLRRDLVNALRQYPEQAPASSEAPPESPYAVPGAEVES